MSTRRKAGPRCQSAQRAAARIPRLRKHPPKPRCRNASRRSLVSHRESRGRGKEAHVLMPAGLWDPRQSIPPCMDCGGALGRTLQTQNKLIVVPKRGFEVSKKPHQLQVGSSLPQGSRVIGKSNGRTSARLIFLCYYSISLVNPSSGHCF